MSSASVSKRVSIKRVMFSTSSSTILGETDTCIYNRESRGDLINFAATDMGRVRRGRGNALPVLLSEYFAQPEVPASFY